MPAWLIAWMDEEKVRTGKSRAVLIEEALVQGGRCVPPSADLS